MSSYSDIFFENDVELVPHKNVGILKNIVGKSMSSYCNIIVIIIFCRATVTLFFEKSMPSYCDITFQNARKTCVELL